MIHNEGRICIRVNVIRGFNTVIVYGKRSVEQCTRGSDSNHKNFSPQVSSDLWNSGASVKFFSGDYVEK